MWFAALMLCENQRGHKIAAASDAVVLPLVWQVGVKLDPEMNLGLSRYCHTIARRGALQLHLSVVPTGPVRVPSFLATTLTCFLTSSQSCRYRGSVSLSCRNLKLTVSLERKVDNQSPKLSPCSSLPLGRTIHTRRGATKREFGHL